MTDETVLNISILKEHIEQANEDIEVFRAAIKALEQEPCEDAINRQAVIDGINRYFHDEYYQRTSIQDCRDCFIEDVIKKLPPVNPQPKTGEVERRQMLGLVIVTILVGITMWVGLDIMLD